jgi:hypothetical protein
MMGALESGRRNDQVWLEELERSCSLRNQIRVGSTQHVRIAASSRKEAMTAFWLIRPLTPAAV